MDQLREFFAKLSFKVDDSGLKAFDKQLDEMKSKMQQAGVSAEQFENKKSKAVRKSAKDVEDSNKSISASELKKQAQIDKAFAQRDKQLSAETKKLKEVERAHAQKTAAEEKASEAKYRIMERDAARQEKAQAKLQALGKVQSAAYQMRDAIERKTGLQQIAARSYDEARTRKTGLMQIAASEYDERRTRNAGVTQYRAIQMNEAMDRRMGLMQVAARREDVRRAARAETDERRLTISHIQALEEDAKRIKAASRATEQRELAERRYAKMMDEAHRMNAQFNRGLLSGRGERITPGKGFLSSSVASGISMRGLTAGGGGLGVGTALGVLGAATGLGFGVANFSHDLQEAQSQLFLFQSTFGGVEKGKSEQERFRALADKMGINYAKNAQGYAGFMAAGMPTIGYEKSLQTYQAFAEYSKVAGVRGDQFKHMMLALQQIMG